MIRRDEEEVARMPLAYAGTTSQFAARWTPETGGVYEIEVWAYDPLSGNTGIDATTVIVTE
ncbi:MAG TPA: hypothetical protein VMT16_10860 [Thermoanaerobaculia bacterium]|nr:hypothetical protein [Thermoanaerobaculia bacterium]